MILPRRQLLILANELLIFALILIVDVLHYYLKNVPNPNSPLHKPYIKFWNEIKQKKYLAGTEVFRLAIDNYLEYLENKTGRSYTEVRDKLYDAIRERNKELEKLLK